MTTVLRKQCRPKIEIVNDLVAFATVESDQQSHETGIGEAGKIRIEDTRRPPAMSHISSTCHVLLIDRLII